MGVEAFGNTAGQFQIRQGIGLFHDHPAGQGTGRLTAGQMQDLFKILGHQQPDLGALFLQHDVSGNSSAMQQRGDLGRADSGLGDQLADAVHDADGLVLRRRRRLQQAQLAVLFIEQQKIGESSTDIHAQAATHCVSPLLLPNFILIVQELLPLNS